MSAPRFNLFRLVGRNLKNRPYRTLAVIVTFAMISAMLFSAQYLAAGAAGSLDRGTGWLGADLIVVPGSAAAAGETSLLTGQPSMFFFSDAGFEKISRIPGVARASPQILVPTLSNESCCSGYLQVVAIDPASDFSLNPWLDESYGSTFGKDAVIVGNSIENTVGSDLMIYGHTFHVTGKLEYTGLRGIDNAVFIRLEDAYIMAAESGQKAAKPLIIPRGMVSQVLVRLEPGVSAAAVGNAIRAGIPGTRVVSQGGLETTVARHLSGITLFLDEAAIAVTAIFLPILVLVSVMLSREMNREVTLLGALGATKAFVLRLILAESFSSAFIGSLAGIGSAAVVLVAFQDFIAISLEIPFSVPPLPALLAAAGRSLLLMLVIGGIAALYPTIRIVRSEAYGKIGDE
jgi:putative ABC transport system permease protein